MFDRPFLGRDESCGVEIVRVVVNVWVVEEFPIRGSIEVKQMATDSCNLPHVCHHGCAPGEAISGINVVLIHNVRNSYIGGPQSSVDVDAILRTHRAEPRDSTGVAPGTEHVRRAGVYGRRAQAAYRVQQPSQFPPEPSFEPQGSTS